MRRASASPAAYARTPTNDDNTTTPKNPFTHEGVGVLSVKTHSLGGMKSEEAKRLKELDEENKRLKKLLAEAELDKSILKEALRGNY